jgi:hypothetical protein
MPEIEKTPCSSSNVEGHGYDEETLTLRIWYVNGTIYDYSGVPKVEYDALCVSPSIGSYLSRSIKGAYGYLKIG